MKQKSLKMSDSFWQAIEGYRVEQGIVTWSEALVTLALMGLMNEREDAREKVAKLGKRGGDHRSDEYKKAKSPA
jgi:hypothetical protein